MADPDENEERHWLERCRAGDTSALVMLFNRHAEGVARTLARRVTGRDASDTITSLVNTTFITLPKTTCSVEFSVRAFIHGIAHNALRHHFRQAKRENRRNGLLLQVAEDITPSAGEADLGPEDALGTKQTRRLVGKALRRLDLDDQVLLELHYWEERSRAEIAVILGVPAGTIAGRLNAAKARLIEKFTELQTARSNYVGQDTSKSHEVWRNELAQHLEIMRSNEADARSRTENSKPRLRKKARARAGS